MLTSDFLLMRCLILALMLLLKEAKLPEPRACEVLETLGFETGAGSTASGVEVSSPHTCKKRVMLQRRLFWPKKICGKSA